MANKEATGKKAKYASEFTVRWRAAVLNAFDCVEKRGKKISEMLADELEKNPIKFMELASKGIVKEFNTEVTHRTAEKLTDDELADIATGRSKGTPEEKTSKTQIH